MAYEISIDDKNRKAFLRAHYNILLSMSNPTDMFNGVLLAYAWKNKYNIKLQLDDFTIPEKLLFEDYGTYIQWLLTWS